MRDRQRGGGPTSSGRSRSAYYDLGVPGPGNPDHDPGRAVAAALRVARTQPVLPGYRTAAGGGQAAGRNHPCAESPAGVPAPTRRPRSNLEYAARPAGPPSNPRSRTRRPSGSAARRRPALCRRQNRRHPKRRAALLQMDHEEVGIRIAQRRYWPDIVLGAGWGAVDHRRDEPGPVEPAARQRQGHLQRDASASTSLSTATGSMLGVREATARLSAAKATHTEHPEPHRSRRSVHRLPPDDDGRADRAVRERAAAPGGTGACGPPRKPTATGTTGVLDLLDSEEVLLDVRLGLVRLETDYMKALAEMERAIGTAFPSRREP